MARRLKHIVLLAALVLLAGACWFWSGARTVAPVPRLSIVFAGMTNNPALQMVPTRIELCQGATGLCAMFWVTNVTDDQFIWFKTASIEQKTETGWVTYVPEGGMWSGIEGSLWLPRYGCFYAVGWPPGLSTNAVWRLQMRHGRDLSAIGIVVNQTMGREIFRKGDDEAMFLTPEVSQ